MVKPQYCSHAIELQWFPVDQLRVSRTGLEDSIGLTAHESLIFIAS
jgi:hypothetical protein